MRIHRFYSKTEIRSKTFDITDRDLVHQWKSVFRYNVGSQIILFDGSGIDYLCIITSLRNLGATVGVIQEIKTEKIKKINLWLCVGLIKKDNFELVVQKVTELGVNHIIPVLCGRSEKKKINIERLNKIAVEASEQSGRGDIPFIHEVMEFSKLLDADLLPNSAIFLNMSGGPISEVIKNEAQNDLAVFVGPEGGWSEEEIKNFAKHNISAVSLGNQILRAETASVAVASLLLLK